MHSTENVLPTTINNRAETRNTGNPVSKPLILARKIGIGAGLIVAVGFLSGCVSQNKYDTLDQQYQQLNQRMSAEVNAGQMRITRLQGAIQVSINSELLFPSGSWQMPEAAQQEIAKIAPILAPQQQNKVMVSGYTDNTPIGPELAKQGVTSNLILSQKRADNVMQYMISQGVNPGMVAAQGFGEANPVDTNSTAEGRAKNRRVELSVVAPN